MSKRSPKKSKRRLKALPALGFAGVSLSMASGATASTGEVLDIQSTSQPHEIFIGEEEVFDTSLSTFYTFDRENGGQTSLAQHLRLAAHGGCGGCGCGHGGGGGGCGHGGGCGGCAAHGGCAGGVHVGCAAGVRGFGCAGVHVHCAGGIHVHCRCAFFRRCFGCGCGGCGGCWGCGTCWIWTPAWGWVNTCWSESTPAGEESRVASEPIGLTTALGKSTALGEESRVASEPIAQTAPAAKQSRVASEPIAQIAVAEEKK